MSRDMYYVKRDARVVIARVLEENGWKIYGYKEDKSDCQSDYYDPADWTGIATNGRYIAVVDNKGKSGFEILLNKEELAGYYNKINTLTTKDREKIEKLQRLADKTTFEGEKENALEKINAIKNKKIDTVEVIAKYERLNFPATNFMVFIYDTESNGIVYKSNSISDWNMDEIKYLRDFSWNDGYLVDNFNYDRLERGYYSYTVQELEKIKTNRTEAKNKVNEFVKELKELDELKKIYRYTEVKGTGIEFEEVKITTFADIEQNKENLYTENWGGEKCKLVEIKSGLDCFRKPILRAEFKKIKKDGSIAAVGIGKTLTSSDRFIENNKFYKSKIGVAKDWKLENRALRLESDIKKTSDFVIVENDELKGYEVKFDKKPSQSVIDSLKTAGFKWSSFGGHWYIKQNKISKEKINEMLK